MKQTILLLNPPYVKSVIRDNYCCFTSKSNYIWPSIDLLVLSGILSKRFNIKVIDAVIEKLKVNECLEKIITIKPEIVISLTGSATYIEDFKFFKMIDRNIKTRLFILGNIAVFKPKLMFDRLSFLEAILHNFTSKDIVKYILGKKGQTTSISYRTESGFKLGKINIQKSKNSFISYPIPRHELFSLEKYQVPFMEQKPMTTVLTAFGCPFSCKFCVASRINYRPRKIISIKKELDFLAKIGIKEFFFEDSTFNANKLYCEKLCKMMIGNKYSFSWSANIHSAFLDIPIAKLMMKAGCHTIHVGVENYSDAILKDNLKATNRQKIFNAFSVAKEVGLNTLGYFIIGLPGETEESIQKTIDFSKKLNPTFASFSIVTADYGTRMRKELIKNKLLDKTVKVFDSSGITNIKHNKIRKKELNTLLKISYIKFYLRPSKILEIMFLSIKNRIFIVNFIGALTMSIKMIFGLQEEHGVQVED